MRKIKIVRIIARLNIGGPAIHTILLSEGLDKTKFDSLLVCGNSGRGEGNMLYYALNKKVTPYFISELKRNLHFFNDLTAFKKIYQVIKNEKPDIIHTHTAKAGALGRLAAIIYNFFHPHRRIVIVHTFHGHIFDGYFNKFKTKIFILIERFLAFFTCRIITLSKSIKEELISLGIGNKNKIEIISLGLELENFLKILPRDDAIINIGIVGRLVPIKNHRLFLEAASKVILDNPDIKLRFKIIGDGELREELEAYSRTLNINTWVDFLGWQKDLSRVYSNLDIVALTSINEGTPVSLIEAMASSRAVVVTDVGGVRDLLGKEIHAYVKQDVQFKVLERGVIVEAKDSDSFAAALNFILKQNNLRENMGILSREYVRNRFSKERLIEDTENLYTNLLGRNKPT